MVRTPCCGATWKRKWVHYFDKSTEFKINGVIDGSRSRSINLSEPKCRFSIYLAIKLISYGRAAIPATERTSVTWRFVFSRAPHRFLLEYSKRIENRKVRPSTGRRWGHYVEEASLSRVLLKGGQKAGRPRSYSLARFPFSSGDRGSQSEPSWQGAVYCRPFFPSSPGTRTAS